MRPLPFLLLLASCAAAPSPERAPAGAATLLLTGGRIWTGDPARPEAAAIAFAGDRIVAFDAAAEALRGRDTEVVALAGRRVVPGFVDAHVHFLGGGAELLAPDLRSADSADAMARRLAAAAAALPAGTWLTGGSWDHERWPGGRLPTRADLDRHVPRHPVFVRRLDGHMAVANSLALRLAGVGKDTQAPDGGEIVRSASGEPEGVLKDAAMALVDAHVPAPDAAERLRRARAALAHAASLGVTGVHDMLAEHDSLATWQELRRAGELTLRVTVYVPITAHGLWGGLRVQRGFGDAWLKVNGVKAFADGSLGSTTALFFEPYADAPNTVGLAQAPLEPGGLFDRQLAGTLAAGLQPAVHAIGDRAIRTVLDRFAEHARADQRPRIEHAQHIHPGDLGRFAAAGVIASMQPYHCADDGRWAVKRIGAARCDTTYAFRDLLDHGAVLAFGSDWPVAPLSPLLGIHAAVTRRTIDGANPDGWVPRQKITVAEALRAYTAGSAFAAFDEHEVGTLREGLRADAVVLDRDPFAIAPSVLDRVAVDVTVAGGKVVYRSAAAGR